MTTTPGFHPKKEKLKNIKEDPIPKPKQLAKQARSKTKAPTPKPPKGSTKIEDEAKPRRRQCAKGHSWRDCLSSCESPTRYSLQGEKTWRIKDASCLHLLLSAKPYSQAKDLKQALHGRQPMRIEGEKGVKTQSAPKHWPRTRKKFWPSNFQSGRPYGRAGKERLCSAGVHTRQNRRAARTNREGTAAIGRFVSERTDRAVDPGNKRSASAEILSSNEFGRPNRSTATKSIGHRPKIFSAKEARLEQALQARCSEYSQLTKEFLSTVALAFPNHNGDQPAGDGLLLFKIGDANGRISISALCQLFGLPNETAHDFKENSKRKQAAFADWTHFANEPFLPSKANKVTTDEFYILTTPFIKHEYKANLGLLLAKTFINVRKLAKDLEGNKKLCVRFGRLITAIVQHVGIDIPNYEPLPKPTPLDLHALQHIHFLNRWTKDPTRFCYEFPIGPANTSLVLLPHEDIPSLRSGVVTFQPNEEDFYVPSSEKPSFPMLTYRTLQHAVKTQRRHQERHVLTTGMARTKL
ncbi:unnamed protein product [Microthlaspi erraticum]|uniref:Arabidopsis retrotransposon Orf1 C-terminal domain-containing protein n=1 Tax=Microthlaspi erraticum TaxID=1685480 RepID=A0A6D2KMH0_9BRAS|nr:unnamed protein product [Microthlaspi erraticum]